MEDQTNLVVEAIYKGKKIALLVIETKRKVPFIDHKFDPYSKDVIRQASRGVFAVGVDILGNPPALKC